LPTPNLPLYPPWAPRQAERRHDIIDVLRGMGYERVVDMSRMEEGGRYFEGTGVLVIDRLNGVAYVALSERADRKLAQVCVLGWGVGGVVLGMRVGRPKIMHTRQTPCPPPIPPHFLHTHRSG
jgi:hypothetical protein